MTTSMEPLGDVNRPDCIFCNRSKLETTLFEDEDIIAIEDIYVAGTAHWLIMPTRHIRDIEVLGSEDLPMLQAMDKVKNNLLQERYPDVPRSEIHAGYHRGRRPLIWPLVLPGNISVRHLHLHVIVNPFPHLWLLKYPAWLPLMWVSDEWLLAKIANDRSQNHATNCTLQANVHEN